MNIIINGGTRGIGREIVNVLASDSSNLIAVTGRDSNKLDEVSSAYANVKTFRVDFSDFGLFADDYENFIRKELKHADILINSAGLLLTGDYTSISENDSRKMMEVNFFGPAAAIRLTIPFMKHGSHILNISSMGGFTGSSKYRGLSYYSASKSAIACLSECLAEEFRDEGIRVNCLALGSVQTEMLEQAFPGYRAPVSAHDMGRFIAGFALDGHKVFNGKVLPVAVTNP